MKFGRGWRTMKSSPHRPDTPLARSRAVRCPAGCTLLVALLDCVVIGAVHWVFTMPRYPVYPHSYSSFYSDTPTVGDARKRIIAWWCTFLCSDISPWFLSRTSRDNINLIDFPEMPNPILLCFGSDAIIRARRRLIFALFLQTDAQVCVLLELVSSYSS